MATNSAIEWTNATWNPLAGCTPVSEGCRNCYAASMALRLEAMGQAKYAGTAKRVGDGRAVFTGQINLDEAALDIPRRWRKGRRIFVNSMSDLFHEAVPPGFIYRVFQVMAETPQHTYQLLTKRPENIMPTLKLYGIGGATAHGRPWPANVWIGTSVEHQRAADERIPHLLQVPAVVRFLSCEPLIGLVNLTPWLTCCPSCGAPRKYVSCTYCEACPDVRGVSWIIAGGESGPQARPMHPAWARSLRDQATAAGIAFHFKQWGEHSPYYEAVEPATGDLVMREYAQGAVRRIGKRAAGRLLDGRTWDEFPQEVRDDLPGH